jgi:hypothetical protein
MHDLAAAGHFVQNGEAANGGWQARQDGKAQTAVLVVVSITARMKEQCEASAVCSFLSVLEPLAARKRQPIWRKQRRQKMIDHVILTVTDFERSVAFYAKTLKPQILQITKAKTDTPI